MTYDLVQYNRGGRRVVRLKPRRAGKRGQHVRHQPRTAVRGRGAQKSWIADAVNKTVELGDIAVSLTEGVELVVINNSALKHIYHNRKAFLTALYTATGGASVKQLGAALGAGVALNPVGIGLAADAFGGIFGAAATPGTLTAGWRAHLSSSVTNNAYQVFQVDIGPIVGAGGLQTMPAPVLSLGVYLYTPAADIVIWSPQNGAGQFSLAPGNMNAAVLNAATTTSNGIVARTLNATSFANFETINMRDIYPRFGACPPQNDEPLGDEGEEDGVDIDGYVPTNDCDGMRKTAHRRAYPALRDG